MNVSLIILLAGSLLIIVVALWLENRQKHEKENDTDINEPIM